MSGSSYMRDPGYVRDQYASERNLNARVSLYDKTTGPFAGDVAFDIVAELAPLRLLEVGFGTGWFGGRVRRELGIEVVGIDSSARMVELGRAEGIDGQVADVQHLPFADESFDCVAAHWMLYHVADLDRGLAEIARVLVPGGRLVAITNRKDHLREMWELVGAADLREGRDLSFSAENGAAALERHFASVEMRDAGGTVEVEHREAVVRYLESTEAWKHLVEAVPSELEPFTARRSNVVFVATKAPT